LCPWRIHEFTRDFQVLDVWSTPTPGGPDDFPRLVELAMSLDPANSPSGVVRALFAVRWVLGDVLGLDALSSGVGSRVPSLRDRLPADLLDTASGAASRALPFSWLYMLGNECAAEIANKTVHGVLHADWVTDGGGVFRGQVAVLVKPNGALGDTYLMCIKPFRHLFVYPEIFKEMERRWRAARDDGVDKLSLSLEANHGHTQPGDLARNTWRSSP
jgi:hypothetical protein